MAIRASIRLQYWQNGLERTPATDSGLYPSGSDILGAITVDASRLDAIVDTAKAINSIAGGIAAAAAGNPLGVLFSAAQLAKSVEDVRRGLADRVGVLNVFGGVTFPHPRYNRIRILFNADSDEDQLSEVGHAPPASPHTQGIQYRADQVNTVSRNAEFWMELDQLRHLLNDAEFFKDFSLAFSLRETDALVTDLSLIANVHVFVFPMVEAAPRVTTDVVYFRRVGQEFPAVVARQRLVEFVPRIGGISDGQGERVTNVPLALTFENGAFRINGAPYDLVQLSFMMQSSRKVVEGRPTIEIDAGVHPDNAGGALLTSVFQPLPRPAFAPASGEYVAEGVGSASIIFEPDRVPLGCQHTVVFSATQFPGGWQSVQNMVLTRTIAGPPVRGLAIGAVVLR